LVIRLKEPQLLYLLKIVESLDQQDQSQLFGLFPQPVAGNDSAYVGTILNSLRTQLDTVSQMRVKIGETPWPAFPPECSDARLAPTRRLRKGVAHAASIVSGGPEHRLVFCLTPQAVENPAAYLNAVSALLPPYQQPVEPVWPRVRLILRDDGDRPILVEKLRREKNAEVLVYEPDLTPEALMDAMAREVVDPAVPEASRMQLLAQLASLDSAYGRFDDAIAKFAVLYDYFKRQNVLVMQAFVLQGLGDIARRTGRLPLAKERYGQGLTLALGTEAPVMMLTLALSIGDVSLELGHYEDAAGHLEIARKLAAGLKNRPVEADALEKLGMAQMGLRRPNDALTTWREAAEISRVAEYRERLASVNERISQMRAPAGPHSAALSDGS
ncbi:MAG TPA: hypothetical protein VGL13_14075, partial [Polyangiaceae bacterium]